MASLRKRNDKWQAQVRRIGHTLRTKTFINRADALRWIRQTEQELDRTGLAYDPSSLERITVADLLRRYVRDVTPGKRGHASEAKRIEVFLRHGWANLTLARITPQAFTQHRDKRLHEVEAGTVIRELGLLRTVFEIARREWDVPMQANPLANVRKPKAASGRNRRLRADELTSLRSLYGWANALARAGHSVGNRDWDATWRASEHSPCGPRSGALWRKWVFRSPSVDRCLHYIASALPKLKLRRAPDVD